jgi:dipeptidyl aminopeptidase/acylaminoacyl peptidase
MCRARGNSVRVALAVLLAGGGLCQPAAAAGRAITVDDLLAIERVSDPRVSPDGGRAVYTVTRPDRQTNRNTSNVWLVSLESGETRQLTSSGSDSGARWAPDGRRIAFISSRDGREQLYTLNVDEPGDARRLTTLSGGADHVLWSPDGRSLAFTSEVYPHCGDDACNAARDAQRGQSPVRARVYDRLLYRHWTSWSDGKRRHPFIVPADGGTPRDLLPGADYDTPPREREGPHPIAFSPDGRTVCFTAVTAPVEATTTNADLFEVDIDGGAPRRLTSGQGFDGSPLYSPDGATIAFRSQVRGGYESDKYRLVLYDRATQRETSLIDAFDRSVSTLWWASDGRAIYFNAEDEGQMPVFAVPVSGGTPRAVTPGRFDGEFHLGGRDAIVVARSSHAAPAELFAIDAGGGIARRLTSHNDRLLASLDLVPADAFVFAGAGGTPVHGMLIRPPAFDPTKRYPVLMLLHGGPQTQLSDAWSHRWNAQVLASPGYVVVMINRRGSTGFGQRFTDDITGDWGGKPFEDLMSGLDFVLRTYSFTDPTRVGAAGASYGGYMANWLASQAGGRFRVLVSHAGVYNLTSLYGATEELWFPEHDLHGTPWSNPPAYERSSPHTHASRFGALKTPTLVITGELDFRVPYTQSLELYTALQRQGVPSRLVVFPDEGHWILKPENSAFWYREVLAWIGRHL